MKGPAARAVRDLVAAGRAVGDDQIIAFRCAHRGQQRQLGRLNWEDEHARQDPGHCRATGHSDQDRRHPLQSGSDELLKKMKRRYLTDTYTNRVTEIKRVMPNACIGVDVIVGFPGETDEAFLETYNYLNQLDISYLHVFTYSERANTEAVEMEGVVPMNVRNKRSKMLRGLSVKKRRAFYESQLGNTLTVLFESEDKDGFIHGFTQNYVKVKTAWNPDLVNTLHEIKLTEIDEDGIVKFDWIKEPAVLQS